MRLTRLVSRHAVTESAVTLHDIAHNKRLDFLVTSDFYRVDIGLVIRRKPIFLTVDEIEIKNIKLEHKLRWKHDLYPLLNKELMDFNLVNQAQRDIGTRSFETANLREKALNSSGRQPCLSVYFLCKHEGVWCFPTYPMSADESLSIAKERLARELGRNDWGASFTNRLPIGVRREQFTDRDQENPYWLKCVGRKVFYFSGLHDWGNGSVAPKFGSDFAWVSKPELNRYLSRADFEFFNRHLPLND